MWRVTDAVVFDLDGVIVDSEPVWERVRRAYVDEHGGTWQADSQRRLMGMSTDEWARYLSDELRVDRTPAQVATDVVAQMAQAYADQVPLIAGAADAVSRMGGSWRLGLASSSPLSLIRTVLDAANVARAFQVVLSTEDVAAGKPSPDVYLEVARRLGVDPRRCVAIEDSSNGVRSAAAAGMAVIAVRRPAYPLDEDAAGQAARVLSTLDYLSADDVAILA
jgi:beta-phosphoglucomutase-like phosphatase (HAD superfamily)